MATICPGEGVGYRMGRDAPRGITRGFSKSCQHASARQDRSIALSTAVSHNLIEAMFCGAIPITNGGAFMAEALADGVNCLAFENEEGLVAAVERALAMNDCEVARMRKAVRDY